MSGTTRPTLLLVLAAVGALAAGCTASNPMAPSSLPLTSEIARRTRFTAVNRLPAMNPYMKAVAARIEKLRRLPMHEEAAVEVALLGDAEVRNKLQEHGSADAGFVAEYVGLIEARGGSKGGPGADWLLVGRAVANPRYVESDTGEEGEREPVGVWDPDYAEGYLELAEIVLDKAHAVRSAFYEAVAAKQVALIQARILEAAKAAAELANEQYRSGTLSRLDQAKEQLAYAEAQKAAARAGQVALAAREALNRELLLFGPQLAWELPDRLPALPAERPQVADAEGLVLREGIGALASRAEANSFTRGVQLRSEAREAHAAMLTAYDLARFQQDNVMPTSEIMMEEQQLHYNAMIDDVFHLLEAAAERMAAEREQVETLAEFWKARARFVQLAGGRFDDGGAPLSAENKP